MVLSCGIELICKNYFHSEMQINAALQNTCIYSCISGNQQLQPAELFVIGNHKARHFIVA